MLPKIKKGFYAKKDNILENIKEKPFYSFLKLASIFLFLALMVLGLLLVGKAYFRLYEIKNELQGASIENIEETLEILENEVDSLIIENKFSDNDLNKNIEKLRENFSKIFYEISVLKILAPKFILVFVQKTSITDYLLEMKSHIDIINENLNEIDNFLQKNEFILNKSSSYERYKSKFEEILFVMDKFEEHSAALFSLLGDRYPRRYIVLLQNSSEIRPTGGFIGGYVTFDLNEGYIKNIEYHDVYEGDGQLTDSDENLIPDEISIVAGKQFGLRDANISPDFSISGANVERLLEDTKNDSADPVIAIDLELAKRLLDLVGGVEIKEFGITLTRENFETLLTFIVESKLSGVENPKKIFEYLPAAFFDKAKQTNVSLHDISILLSELVAEKHIQAFSKNSEIQAFFEDYGVAGLVNFDNKTDFVFQVEISVGGNKTDRWIKEEIIHNTMINGDGKITDELRIKRENTMSDEILASQIEMIKANGFDIDQMEKDSGIKIREILFTGINKNTFRVYVPKGAILKHSQGVDMDSVETKYDNDLALQYFSFQTKLAMGNSEEIVLVYEVPLELDLDDSDVYRFNIPKQAGKDAIEFTKKIYLGEDLNIYKFSPDNFEEIEDNGYVFKGILKQEINLGVVVGE